MTVARNERFPVSQWVTITQTSVGRLQGKMVNISRTGFRLDCMVTLNREQAMIVKIGELPVLGAKIIWTNVSTYGCEFEKTLSIQILEQILGRSAA